MLDSAKLKRLARELRNVNGIERTPSQVDSWIRESFKHPERFLNRVLDDPELISGMAGRMRNPLIDDAPGSDTWSD